jgi:hypothetical protein
MLSRLGAILVFCAEYTLFFDKNQEVLIAKLKK